MKKGFTLVELIACIGIMAMLATIIITIEVKKINETKEKSRDVLINSIELAAVKYAMENLDSLSNLKQYDWENIELQTLIENNKLTSNLLDQTTGKFLPLTDIVYVTKSYNGKISAKYYINQNHEVSIMLNGSYNVYLDKNETYIEEGAVASSNTGEDVTPTIVINNTINFNKKGNYKITYQIDDKTIERNIIILNDKKSLLTIDLDGGTTTNDVSGLYSQETFVNVPIPTKAGYEFNGWDRVAGNGMISLNTITIGSENTIIKAVWRQNLFTITYNCNGGQGSTSSTTLTTILTANRCYKITEGSAGVVYYFKGWAKTSDATSVLFTDEQNITNSDQITSNTTLYAIWDTLFTITGNYEVIDDSNGNWRVKIKGATGSTYGVATLKLNIKTQMDIFVVGGGGGGSQSSYASGGGGGYANIYKAIEIGLGTYSIVVGDGGSANNAGSQTYAFNTNYKADGGGPGVSESRGGNGGSGGGYWNARGASYGASASGSGQGSTTCEFGEGSTSACNTNVTAYSGGGSGQDYTSGSVAGGGGAGGSPTSAYGVAGTANTGGGGGAGFYGAAKGGSGIVVIRNHRG